jgi:hypothetical protein
MLSMIVITDPLFSAVALAISFLCEKKSHEFYLLVPHPAREIRILRDSNQLARSGLSWLRRT